MLNSVSNYEYIQLLATLEGQYDKAFNCFLCINQYRQKRDFDQHQELYAEHLRKARELKGCFEEAEVARFISDDVHWFKCIGNFRGDWCKDVIEAYDLYKKGVLPYPGSFMEQPAKIIDMFDIIEEIIKAKIKEQQDKNKRKNG